MLDEEVWEGKVSRWNKKVEELDRTHDVPPEVDIHREEGIHSTAGRAVCRGNCQQQYSGS
jgi:hypothetical protein